MATGIVCAVFVSATYAANCPKPNTITITKSDQGGYLYSAPGWRNYKPYPEKLEIKNFFSVRYTPDSSSAEIGIIGSCAYKLQGKNPTITSLLVLTPEDDKSKVLKPTGENWKSRPVGSKTLLCKKDKVEQCNFKWVHSKP